MLFLQRQTTSYFHRAHRETSVVSKLSYTRPCILCVIFQLQSEAGWAWDGLGFVHWLSSGLHYLEKRHLEGVLAFLQFPFSQLHAGVYGVLSCKNVYMLACVGMAQLFPISARDFPESNKCTCWQAVLPRRGILKALGKCIWCILMLTEQILGILKHPSDLTCRSWCLTEGLSKFTRWVFLHLSWPCSLS